MDETKIELIGLNEKLLCSEKEHTAFQLKNLIPSVKYAGGSFMAWACFAASWPGKPAIIDGTMNSEWYPNSKGKRQDICLRTESQENVGHAARQPQAYKSFYQRMVKEEQS